MKNRKFINLSCNMVFSTDIEQEKIDMNKLAFSTCSLVFMFLLLAVMAIVQAQATVGVSKGDEFEYTMYSLWNSNFLDTPPSDMVELNRTQWVKVAVTEVSGSKISLNVTTHFRNGTEQVKDGYCDVDTGERSDDEIPPFIGANINTYGEVNPSADNPFYINATIIMDYEDGQRETNLLSFVETEENEQVGTYTRIAEYYFDKATGVPVKYRYDFYYTGLRNVIYYDLVSSNVWVIPEFQAWIILPFFVLVALLTIVLKRNSFKT